MPLDGPFTTPGQRIGLLGGSFDPPHAGHAHITRRALRSFGLDRVWWLVTPGNPLKAQGPAALASRVAACRALMRHPRVVVTDIEAHMRVRFTADTLPLLCARYPRVRFVWLMGADNLATLHRWNRWRDIMETMPVGVLARPGEQVRAGLAPAARAYADARLAPEAAPALADGPAPRWALLPGPMTAASSTALRGAGAWP